MMPSYPLHRSAAALVLALGALACLPAAAAVPAHSKIGWVTASTDAEVDKAFAQARQTGRPVYLYWGAVWCPPCNQVKATLFNRPDFAERSRAFIPVYVDGDRPGAQKIASRFKVSGYPTMVVFRPDGTEITRLPGEVDPQRYLLTLSAALNAQAPVKDLVARAQAGQKLTDEQWNLLAFYSWDTDEQQVMPNAELGKRLGELAAHVPANLPQLRDRLALKAIAARIDGPADAAVAQADRAAVERMLADPESVRQQWDQLSAVSDKFVKYLAPDPTARVTLAASWEKALARRISEGGLSNSEQVDGLYARVVLLKLAERSETLSPARVAEMQKEVARVVAATTDRYERQAVVPSAAHVLSRSGLLDASDAMLKAELPRAVAPYYHMLALADNAKTRKDAKTALSWYEQAWKASEGPATRVQWGTNYVRNIIELTPNDIQRISTASRAVVGGLEPKGETFFERNQRSLQRMAKRMAEWQGADASRSQVVTQVRVDLEKVCKKVPAKDAGRGNCEQVFNAKEATSS
ncbi:thioredoxin family protein [Ramlibacter sp. XY19]|uniref:thioredoxin family protein n=1 Tax=Ramlibacter paludis TaxID=2908000 RepID=UPI0023D9A633|nr:thioredoxin fold domain-containing protein [Ramlibacter paludis]MCG2591614.1 thioredoxin family protein [Ramlibacter paludis]